MRRAVMGTVAMWLAGIGGLEAQNAPGYLADPQMQSVPQLAPNNHYPQQQGYYDPAMQNGQRQQMPPGYGPANAIMNPAMTNGYPQSMPMRPTYANQYANPGMYQNQNANPGMYQNQQSNAAMYQNQYANPGMYQNQYANPGTNSNQFANQAMMGRGMMIAGANEALPQPNAVPPQQMNGMPAPGYGPPMTYPPGYGAAYDGGDYCGDGYCNNYCNRCCPNGACGPEGRSWASAELLFFWTKGQGMPPLVTSGVDLANPGIIGQPGTVVLFGGERVGEDLRMGLRVRGGFWIDECQMLGVEGSFFFIANRNVDFMSECQVGDFVARPFFNLGIGAQDAEIVCAPGVLCGHVAINAFNEMFGADANIRRNLCCNCDYRADLVLGFRYMHLLDDLSIEENLTNLDPNRGAIGEGFIVRDRFHANNNFYGGQVGAAGEFRSGQFFMDWRRPGRARLDHPRRDD